MFLTAYLASLGFGAVLIGAAVFLGDHDHDSDVDHDHDFDKDFDFDAEVDLDADVDHDHDHDHDHDIDVDHVASDAPHGVERRRYLPFLSMRFWTYALGTGGATGTVLTLLELPLVIHLPVALGSGLVLGWTAAWGFHTLKRATADSTIRPADLKGSEARVVLPIRPGERGKIRLHIQGQSIELLARSRETRIIGQKETVLIVQIDEDTAIVTPVPQLSQNPSS